MLREAFKALLSGLVVYLVVVTCGGTGSPGAPDATAEAADGSSLDSLADGSSLDGVPACECPPPPPLPPEYTKAGSRLRPTYTLGVDGSKTVNPGVMFDTERGESCAFGWAEDGKRRCLPQRTAYHSGVFADGDCTVRVAHALGTECSTTSKVTPATAFEDRPQVSTGCGGGQRILALVQEVDPQALYRKTGTDGECAPFAYPDGSGQRVFIIGDVIPPTAFVEGTLTHD